MNNNQYQNNNQFQNNQLPNSFYQSNGLNYNPYVQPNGQYPPNPNQKKEKNKAAIIVGIAAGVIILILVITLIVIISDRNSGNTYNEYNTYVSAEYTEISNGLKDIEKDFFTDGKIPEDKIPILFDKQEEYLKEQQEKGVIKFYNVKDNTIHIEFNPNENGECDEPLDYYPGMYYEEIIKENNAEISERLCSAAWLDLNTASSSFGEVQYRYDFTNDGKVTMYYSNEVEEKELEATYELENGEVTFSLEMPYYEITGDSVYTLSLIADSDFILYREEMPSGEVRYGLLVDDSKVDFSSDDKIIDYLGNTNWYSESLDGTIYFYENSDGSNSVSGIIKQGYSHNEAFGNSCSNEVAFLQIPSDNDELFYYVFLELTDSDDKLNAYIFTYHNDKFSNEYEYEQWSRTD